MKRTVKEAAETRGEIVRILLAHYGVDPLNLVQWQTQAIEDAVRQLMRVTRKAVE